MILEHHSNPDAVWTIEDHQFSCRTHARCTIVVRKLLAANSVAISSRVGRSRTGIIIVARVAGHHSRHIFEDAQYAIRIRIVLFIYSAVTNLAYYDYIGVTPDNIKSEKETENSESNSTRKSHFMFFFSCYQLLFASYLSGRPLKGFNHLCFLLCFVSWINICIK